MVCFFLFCLLVFDLLFLNKHLPVKNSNLVRYVCRSVNISLCNLVHVGWWPLLVVNKIRTLEKEKTL
ncbi:hypothetical protein HanRHA438_Chr15g0696061 [Helianthus annuus]|nr:hypothetical protein HanRHA438_Chr15g0696061 [Helianthus annuus]